MIYKKNIYDSIMTKEGHNLYKLPGIKSLFNRN